MDAFSHCCRFEVSPGRGRIHSTRHTMHIRKMVIKYLSVFQYHRAYFDCIPSCLAVEQLACRHWWHFGPCRNVTELNSPATSISETSHVVPVSQG